MRVQMRSATEVELVDRCLRGDGEAWTQLYCHYEAYVKQHISILSIRLGAHARDHDLVDEVAQRVWASLIPARAHLRAYDQQRGGLNSFLRARIRQELYLYLRAESRRQTTLAAVSKGPEEPLVPFDTCTAMLGEFLAGLPPRQRWFCEARLLDSGTTYVGPARSPDASRKMTQRILARFLASQGAD